MNIQAVASMLRSIRELLPHPVSFAISDRTRFVFYQSSPMIDLKIKPGDPLREGMLTWRALKEGRRVSQFMAKNPFHTPYFATSTPIMEGEKIEGCITAIYPPSSVPFAAQLPRQQFLIGKAEDRWIPVPFREIAVIEAENGRTWLHTVARGKLLNKFNLTELESILPPDQFIRCHRAYIVNVNAIEEIHPDFHSTFILLMKDGKLRVPVGQKFASRFRHYMGI
ncbi:LytTR family DNA-binding domain-containing protein [Bacillaceae bacterium]